MDQLCDVPIYYLVRLIMQDYLPSLERSNREKLFGKLFNLIMIKYVNFVKRCSISFTDINSFLSTMKKLYNDSDKNTHKYVFTKHPKLFKDILGNEKN